MKTRNLITIFLISILFCVCILHERGKAKPSADVEPARIGVVSIIKVMATGTKAREFEQSLTTEGEKIKAELSKLEEDIKSARDVLRVLKPDSSDFKKRSRELMEKEIELESKAKFYQQEFGIRQQRWTEESFKAILELIDKVAKAKGYDVILAKEEYQWPSASPNDLNLTVKTSEVLYHSEEMDITADVLAAWNASDFDSSY